MDYDSPEAEKQRLDKYLDRKEAESLNSDQEYMQFKDLSAQIGAANRQYQEAKANAAKLDERFNDLMQSRQHFLDDPQKHFMNTTLDAVADSDRKDDLSSQLDQSRDENEKLREELADLKAQNRVLTDTISDERSSYKAGMQSIKTSITEQVSEMKSMMQEMRQALTGSLKDVLKWRKDNGINDRTELGQIVQQASKPARKQDHESTGPRLN